MSLPLIQAPPPIEINFMCRLPSVNRHDSLPKSRGKISESSARSVDAFPEDGLQAIPALLIASGLRLLYSPVSIRRIYAFPAGVRTVTYTSNPCALTWWNAFFAVTTTSSTLNLKLQILGYNSRGDILSNSGMAFGYRMADLLARPAAPKKVR